MTQKEIIEGNKLIAEFACIKNKDGSIYNNTGGGYPEGCMHFNMPHCPINTMFPFEHIYAYINNGEWNHNWSWLMPVVEKIEKTLFEDDKSGNRFYPYITIGQLHCQMTKSQFYVGENSEFISRCGLTKIEATWLAVVEFIKWYNQNKK